MPGIPARNAQILRKLPLAAATARPLSAVSGCVRGGTETMARVTQDSCETALPRGPRRGWART
jgi:hypothetical protein